MREREREREKQLNCNSPFHLNVNDLCVYVLGPAESRDDLGDEKERNRQTPRCEEPIFTP